MVKFSNKEFTLVALDEGNSYLHEEYQNKIVATENARSINPGLKDSASFDVRSAERTVGRMDGRGVQDGKTGSLKS